MSDRAGDDVTTEARETVGELVERVGEREAYIQIVAYNIKLRSAIAAYFEEDDLDTSEAILRSALRG